MSKCKAVMDSQKVTSLTVKRKPKEENKKPEKPMSKNDK